VPVPGHHFEVALVGPGRRVEYDHRAGVEIRAFAWAGREIGRRIPAGDIQLFPGRVQRIRRPGCAARDRCHRLVRPRRCIEWCRRLRSASWIAQLSRHQKKFPDDLACPGVERVDASLHALAVSTRVAHEDQAVPGDRRSGRRLAELCVRYGRLPQPSAGFEIVGQHSSVRATAIETTVEIGSAAIAVENPVCVVLVRSPILSTSGRIDRKDVMVCCTDQRAVHYNWAGREAPSLLSVVSAQHPESTHVIAVNLIERRVTR